MSAGRSCGLNRAGYPWTVLAAAGAVIATERVAWSRWHKLRGGLLAVGVGW